MANIKWDYSMVSLEAISEVSYWRNAAIVEEID